MLAPVTWYPGTVISRNRARVAAEVEGRLEWVAEIGAAIAEGEVVARLDDALLRQSLAENEAAVGSASARLTYLEAQVERLRKLVSQNTATRSRLDEAVAERDVTRSELSAARARVALTAERLERTRIKAPFGGIVTERVLQSGEWAESGRAVVRLVDAAALEVQVWIPIAALAFVREGGELTVEANPSETTGEVRTIVPVGDNRSRLYELRLAFDGEPGRWGRTCGSQSRPRLRAPSSPSPVTRWCCAAAALPSIAWTPTVSPTGSRSPPGIAQDELIEVDGIAPGDRVVIRGGERLRPGQPVRVVNAEPSG